MGNLWSRFFGMTSTENQKFTPKSEELKFLDDHGEPTMKLSSEMRFADLCSDDVIKHDILDFGDEGFLLKGLLTAEECKSFIEFGEQTGFKDMFGYRKIYRNNKRIMVHSERLANLLWTRIETFLHPIVIEDSPLAVHVCGTPMLMRGKWMPLSVNPLFRLCKYNPGGHFAPHYDGMYQVSNKERSMKTLMLYLNSEFDGGTTNFVNEKQQLYKDSEGKYCAEEKNVLYRIRPEPGMAIIFNHHRLHEGEAVRNGSKYILRTDIMFKKCEPSGKEQSEEDSKEEQACRMIQEAERLEASGENMAAMELYRQAYKLSPSLEQAQS